MEEQDDSMDTNGNLPIPQKQQNAKIKREVVVNPTIIEFQKVNLKFLPQNWVIPRSNYLAKIQFPL